MKNDIVSIVTPAYNVEKYIEYAIDSVINQIYTNWELLIIDDNSTDNTREVINSAKKKDSRIKLILINDNKGAAYARNLGLKYAKGNLIAFLDSDDFWLPNKLDKQVKFMLQNNLPISFTRYEAKTEDLSASCYFSQFSEEVSYSQYLKNTIIGMSTSMINKELVGEFEFVNLRTRQDTYLWISLLRKGFNAYGIDDVLTIYRVREDSISSNKFKAAKRVWQIYFNLEKMGLFRSIYYFANYVFNAFKKRYNTK